MRFALVSVLAAAAAAAAPAAPAGAAGAQECSVLDIPACIGWVVECPSHAPDWALRFTPLGVEAEWMAGEDLNTPVARSGQVTARSAARSAARPVAGARTPATAFETDLGVAGTLEVLRHPTCADGHFFDAAPFRLTLSAAPPGTSMAPGETACCIYRPQ